VGWHILLHESGNYRLQLRLRLIYISTAPVSAPARSRFWEGGIMLEKPRNICLCGISRPCISYVNRHYHFSCLQLIESVRGVLDGNSIRPGARPLSTRVISFCLRPPISHPPTLRHMQSCTSSTTIFSTTLQRKSRCITARSEG